MFSYHEEHETHEEKNRDKNKNREYYICANW